MDEMTITSAQYVSFLSENKSVRVVVDGATLDVPLDPANRHYAEIMRQQSEGLLTIADAD